MNCTPCSLPICRALLSRTGSLASAQGKVPFAATWGTGSSREGQILIALVLALQTPKHQQLLLGQVQPRSCLQTLSCPWEWDEWTGLPSSSQQTFEMGQKWLCSVLESLNVSSQPHCFFLGIFLVFGLPHN